jgi:excisionase family DNA binding protein
MTPMNSQTAREVAKRLGVTPVTVYALVDRGELEQLRVSNAIWIEPGELVEYVARCRCRHGAEQTLRTRRRPKGRPLDFRCDRHLHTRGGLTEILENAECVTTYLVCVYIY